MADSRRASSIRFRWLLDYNPQSGIVIPLRSKLMAVMLATDVAFAAVLSLPVVTRATGVSSRAALGLVGTHALWGLLASALLAPNVRRHPAFFHVYWFGNLLAGVGISCLLAAFTHDPRTLLWCLPILYAAINGTTVENSLSYVLLLVHLLGPIVTIPLFTADTSSPWASAGPLICGVSSAAVYLYTSSQVAHWQRVLRERDEALAALREREVELHRLRLARDLHDSVGSTLGLLALQSELLERYADDPAKVRQLAGLTRDAARDGLGDLRGVLEAIAPPGATLGALGESLQELAARQAAGCDITVRVEAGRETPLDPSLRLTLVRVFQEALRNALVHGRARQVRVTMHADTHLRLLVQDDGQGFDVAAVKRGRGLNSMRARASEGGGSFDIESAPGRGTRLVYSVPLNPPQRMAS